tara:strand:+ start:150 stop:506 length:357 start_codon:yes stop_codon:yes gene_type:complete
MNKNFQAILIVGGVICGYFIWKASKTPNDVNLDQPLPDETDADGNIVGGKVDVAAPIPCHTPEMILEKLASEFEINNPERKPDMMELKERAKAMYEECKNNQFSGFTKQKKIDKFIKK